VTAMAINETPKPFPSSAPNGYQVGTFVQLPSPEIVELFGLSGFDFVVLDLEHGAYGFDELRDLMRAAELRSVAPIVRVPDPNPSLLSKVMDLGAPAVIVPQFRTVEEVRGALAATRYPPEGTRGYCSGVRAAGFAGLPGFTTAANAATNLIPLIENLDLVGALDEVLTLPGLRAVLVGPGDLSSAMGRPGDWLNPPVSDLLDDIVSRAQAHGITVGMHVKEPSQAARWYEKGVRFFTYGMDAQLILLHFKQLHQALASEIQNSGAGKR
jgi:4-hydroxy-2-oxoheptanedioate aldolase